MAGPEFDCTTEQVKRLKKLLQMSSSQRIIFLQLAVRGQLLRQNETRGTFKSFPSTFHENIARKKKLRTTVQDNSKRILLVSESCRSRWTRTSGRSCP